MKVVNKVNRRWDVISLIPTSVELEMEKKRVALAEILFSRNVKQIMAVRQRKIWCNCMYL